MPACGCRAPLNGMRDPTLLPWRPAVVHRRTPPVVSDLCTRQMTPSTPDGKKPAVRCYPAFAAVTLCAE